MNLYNILTFSNGDDTHHRTRKAAKKLLKYNEDLDPLFDNECTYIFLVFIKDVC